MEQYNKKEELSLVEAEKHGNKIVLDLGDALTNEQFNFMSNKLKEITEVLHLGLERHSDKIDNVEKLVQTKHITPQQLRSLESIVDKKAKEYVDRSKGVQLNIDVMLSYDGDDLKELQKLINSQYGKTKQKIWVDLNKNCLERGGTEPKNRILSTQVDEAFDFVRTWGGFSV